MTITVETTSSNDIPAKLAKVREGFRAGTLRDVNDRVTQLRQLKRFLIEEEPAIVEALRADLGKSAIEAYTTEIGFTINEVDHMLKNIEKWTSPRKVGLPIHQRPGSGRIVPEPLGTVLIISPWNYPLQLLLAPLVPAIAAGNTAVLKPSEIAPATAALVEQRLLNYLDSRVVQVVTGGVDETTELLAEPWDHIFYTGNGTVGKIVMRAAAEHLTPVTLELGGKSPAIVTTSADVAVSARRIAWGKCINAGQTCVAPDYVLVAEAIADEFLADLGAAITEFYGDDVAASADYGRIVSERHFDRLSSLLDRGGYDEMVIGGAADRSTKFFPPTVLTGVDPDSALMSEEIFGPILPVLTYRDLGEAIDFVNARPKPLALYVFAGNDRDANRVVSHTSSGGVTINHTLLHLAIPDFPFGGVGPSGMGSYHGEAGFNVFSHLKPVLRRGTKPDPKIAYPPYTDFKQKVIRKML
jgi:aldehyde dehydrogenase (NAD+)